MDAADWVRAALNPDDHGKNGPDYDPETQMFRRDTPDPSTVEKHQRFLRWYFADRRPQAAKRVVMAPKKAAA